MSTESSGMAPQNYKESRDPKTFLKFHEHARTHPPNPLIYNLVKLVTGFIALGVFRLRAHGLENVPESGGVILAPNHGSYMDHFFVGLKLRRKIHFVGKSQMFKGPMGWFYALGGVIPVARGWRDEEMFTTVRMLLEAGEIVVFYPEAGRSRVGKIGEAKSGIGRLALETGAPIVPAAIHGTYEVRQWKKLFFPAVTVEFCEPLHFEQNLKASRDDRHEVARVTMEAVSSQYANMESSGKLRRPLRLFPR